VEVLGFEIRRLVADGDTVVALGLERARARPTGRLFETPFAHVWTISDGRVAAFEDHLDSAALVAAFGTA
jgi:ketosteroid isomerase-like protein